MAFIPFFSLYLLGVRAQWGLCIREKEEERLQGWKTDKEGGRKQKEDMGWGNTESDGKKVEGKGQQWWFVSSVVGAHSVSSQHNVSRISAVELENVVRMNRLVLSLDVHTQIIFKHWWHAESRKSEVPLWSNQQELIGFPGDYFTKWELICDRTNVHPLMGIDLQSYWTHTDGHTTAPLHAEIYTQVFQSLPLYCHISLMSFSHAMRSSGREPTVKQNHISITSGEWEQPSTRGGCNRMWANGTDMPCCSLLGP